MNKEVIVAIIIGVALGIGGALYFSNSGSKSAPRPTNNTLSLNSVEITPKLTDKSKQLAQFSNLPAQEALLTKNQLTLTGKADEESILIAANRLEIVPLLVKKGAFTSEIRLKPGVNEIVLYESLKDREQLKILKLFYLEVAKESKPDSEATEEADILKDKLEAKVLELRNKPERVVSGEIKALSGKVLTLLEKGSAQKITVEPEITDFSEVSGYSLNPITYEDLSKGDTVTAFISDIGGDKISYTLYREPELTIAAGKVSNIDDKDYQITLIDFDKSSYGADIETSTIQKLFDSKSKKVQKSGFSKLEIGQRIFARLIGTPEAYSIAEYLIID